MVKLPLFIPNKFLAESTICIISPSKGTSVPGRFFYLGQTLRVRRGTLWGSSENFGLSIHNNCISQVQVGLGHLANELHFSTIEDSRIVDVLKAGALDDYYVW
jgi:hypothetical protein